MKMWRKPLDADEFAPPKGEVCIIEDRCKGCGFCIEFCPRDVLTESERFNSKGYHPPEVTNPDACVDCELCELICPEFAVYVLGTQENGKKEESAVPSQVECDKKAAKVSSKGNAREEGS